MPHPWKRPHGKALVALTLALGVLAFAGLPAVPSDAQLAGQVAPVAVDSQLQADEAIQQVLALTNQERARQGLPPLTLDPALCRSALAHGQDMASHDFFSHTGSDGSTVDERIKAAGYDPLWAYGENIAAGQLTPEEAVNAWMNSEGHRANILSPYYEHIGVSYVYQPGTTYVYYWTQDFASHVPVEVEATPEPTTPLPTAVPPTPAPPTALPPTPTTVPPATALPTASPLPAATAAVAPTAASGGALALDRTEQVMRLLNDARAEAGLPALALDPDLALAAQAHSADMAGHDLFSHIGFDGSTAEARIKAAGFGSGPAETIAGGQATAEEVVGAWLANPRLRRHILSPGLCCAGVGYAYDGESSYRHYWTLDLAAREPAVASAAPVTASPLSWLSRAITSLLRLLGLARVG